MNNIMIRKAMFEESANKSSQWIVSVCWTKIIGSELIRKEFYSEEKVWTLIFINL